MLPLRILLCLYALAALSPAIAAEAVSVQLIWKHQFEFAAFYAAQELGYYRDAGLEVTIREGGPGIDAVREVVEGRADFGVGTSALVLERYQGKPVVALATLMQHSPIALLARRASNRSSVHDLAGEPIAVDPHSRDEIEAYLRAAGLKAEQIRFVDQSDWTLDTLDRGEIAAKVVYVSNEPFLIRDRQHDYLLLVPRSAGVDLYGNMLFSREEVIRKRPAVVEAFRKATLRGLVYALENPEALADLILTRYDTQKKSRAHLLYEAKQIRDLTRPDIVEPGYMSPGRWQHVVNVYAGQGKLPADFSLNGFLYDPTPKVVPGWMTWTTIGALLALLLSWAVIARVRRLNRFLQHEIGERTQAEKALLSSEAKYRELVENAHAVTVRLTPEGRISYFNEMAEKLFGYRAAEVLDRPAMGTIVPMIEEESGRDLTGLLSSIMANPGRYAINENENLTRDGRRLWLRWANRVIVDEAGKAVGLLCVGHDITEQHRMERELADYRQHLEAMVEARTAELSLAKDAAEAASRAKSTFLTNMSHELRTPFHGILGAITLARVRMADTKGQDLLDKAKTAANRLLHVINDILDISKIEADRMELESVQFQLLPIFESLSSLLEIQARGKGVRLTTEIAPALAHRSWLGDPLRLSQVLINLAGNAVKFTDQGSISVRALAAAPSSSGVRIRFEVEDTGIGIREADQPRLFSAFEQADNSITRKYGGTGLGLAICKRLVTLMGGEIGVISAPDKGSTFWFELTLPEALPEAKEKAPPPDHHGEEAIRGRHSGTRILIVEDDPVNREIARTMVEDVGLVVDLACDGAEGVRLAGERRYALILMDMQMPVMNGIDATQAILAEATNASTPILAMSANVFPEDRARCQEAGMVDHIPKPVEARQLYAILADWLDRAALRESERTAATAGRQQA